MSLLSAICHLPSAIAGLMARTRSQPPINRNLRSPEHHDFWPGFAVAIAAAVFILLGALHTTRVETTDGSNAREFQLIKAFARGGLEVLPAVSAPDPAQFNDPALAIAALERMAQEEAKGKLLRYRVNLGAADPCPT
jgi:hypothetical protein